MIRTSRTVPSENLQAFHGVLWEVQENTGFRLIAVAMGKSSSLRAAIRARLAAAEKATQAVQFELERKILAGPPIGSGIPFRSWEYWHRYGFFVCPRTKRTCIEAPCGLGVSCASMRVFGLDGDGSPLRYELRPLCGARNRQRTGCRMKIVPGKRRCRFHGGLSTGPKTPEGRARIAAAQRLRWARTAS